eukprot:6607565-Prymnesium_polylepis.1
MFDGFMQTCGGPPRDPRDPRGFIASQYALHAPPFLRACRRHRGTTRRSRTTRPSYLPRRAGHANGLPWRVTYRRAVRKASRAQSPVLSPM